MELTLFSPAFDRPLINWGFQSSGALPDGVTLTRASNATMVDVSGNVCWAPANNAPYSTPSAANWTVSGATITSGEGYAPDGTMSMARITDTSATSNHIAYLAGAVIQAGYTFTRSMYFAAGTHSWVQMSAAPATFGENAWANFDLTNGVVGNKGSAVTAGVEEVPGWPGIWRCWMTMTATASGTVASGVIVLTNNTDSTTRYPSYAGGSGSVLAWGLKTELTSYNSPQPFHATNGAAYFGPRFEYDPITHVPMGLLIEEQRTNLVQQSALSAAWYPENSHTLSPSTSINNPHGRAGSALLTSTGGNQCRLNNYVSTSATVGGSYTSSIYVKQGTARYFYITVNVGGVSSGVLYDIQSGTVVGNQSGGGAIAASGIIPANDGWYRIWCTVVATSTTSSFYTMRPGFASSAALTFPNDTVTSGLTGYFYGAQHEAGAFPTSYIQTTSAAATRAADQFADIDISAWFNADEGTIYAEAQWLGSDTTFGGSLIWLEDGTLNNIMSASISDAGVVVGSLLTPSTMAYSNDSTALARGDVIKVALAYKAGQNKFYVNGVNTSAGTDFETSVVPSGIDELLLGHIYDGSGLLSGNYKTFKYWPKQKADSQLQGLTS